MVSPPKGPTALAVIYDSQVKASLEDAQSLFAWLKESSGTAKAETDPLPRRYPSVKRYPSFRIGFIAAGMESHYGRILDFARRNRTLTISADLSCVRSGKCTVGVAGAPRVEVVISQQGRLVLRHRIYRGLSNDGDGKLKTVRVSVFASSLSILALASAANAAADGLDYGRYERLFGEPVTIGATGKPERLSDTPVQNGPDQCRRHPAFRCPRYSDFAAKAGRHRHRP